MSVFTVYNNTDANLGGSAANVEHVRKKTKAEFSSSLTPDIHVTVQGDIH